MFMYVDVVFIASYIAYVCEYYLPHTAFRGSRKISLSLSDDPSLPLFLTLYYNFFFYECWCILMHFIKVHVLNTKKKRISFSHITCFTFVIKFIKIFK